MMDKNKVLPLVGRSYTEGEELPPPLFRDGWYLGIQTQQDADWERVKPLVEAMRILAEYAKAKGKPAPEWRG